jgi:hypothetical protein
MQRRDFENAIKQYIKYLRLFEKIGHDGEFERFGSLRKLTGLMLQ